MTESDLPREPVLNLPGALIAILIVLAGIHLFRSILPPESDQWLIWTFGFVPARFDTSVLVDRFAEYGGKGAKVWTFLTYSLLHANFTHLAVNVLWLLPFGSAVARRFGAIRFFLFLAVAAIAGAGAHLITHPRELAPMIGASAAVSGAMAAAIRFAFARGSFLSFRRGDADAAARVPAQPLLRALRQPRVITFLAVWFAINIIFGLGSNPFSDQAESIAWQAHIGGFLAGLLLFSLFDPIPPASRKVAGAPAA
ncbi:rhomboid family intramembrane serine protease [Bradyrhizobium sp. LHD-71]|uniref:rhomboid family intramembrane serine protease n=1 Tax=Bradyrhizobium sp. LHD-71 TaxID=3072141 RepID=UPI00280ECF68|nr:rhomboid family intramembrane serine protease [Bradyrhizobium sp. LHD-71]MDQ8726563.1 rhomboid family intramembrane serine protease [Bradyrhizobium sp. LHD-71]